MSKKKPTAADRPEFRREMAQAMLDYNIGVAEVTSDATLLCTHAADFDPANNVLWELQANKSAVRKDVLCSGCFSAVAMSNHFYERYKLFDKKPRVVCSRCALTMLTENSGA